MKATTVPNRIPSANPFTVRIIEIISGVWIWEKVFMIEMGAIVPNPARIHNHLIFPRRNETAARKINGYPTRNSFVLGRIKRNVSRRFLICFSRAGTGRTKLAERAKNIPKPPRTKSPSKIESIFTSVFKKEIIRSLRLPLPRYKIKYRAASMIGASKANLTPRKVSTPSMNR